mgnify:CR=1 FL=1
MLSGLILADDLTGACDTGAVFARRGLNTVVRLDPAAPVPADGVVVISTDSRYLPEVQAAEVVRQVLRGLAVGGAVLVYKKIDSTLRGNAGAELRAVMAALGHPRALVCPAFPGQGRVVRAGRVWVNGVPLEDTAFAREAPGGEVARALGLLSDCRLLALEQVRAGEEALTALLSQGGGVVVADAETDADLAALARAGRRAGVALWCGSAGLARALAAGFKSADAPQAGKFPQGPALVVAGSRSMETLEQVAALEACGAVVLSLTGVLPGDSELIARAAADGLRAGQTVVICARGLPHLPGSAAQVAGALAWAASAALRAVERLPALLILTGGETAAAVCRRLECTHIRLVDEVEAGLALGVMRDGRAAGLWVITKAGGFGRRDTLTRIILPESSGRLRADPGREP